jgi:opacity protein-like surface antigen
MRAIILLFILSIHFTLFAGDETRKGTSGADQLLIPVGARSIATGGAFISSISGVEAIYYNPAGLDVMKGSEAMFSFMNYIADINISYFAIGTQLGELGSMALDYKSVDFGDIPITTTDNPDGTGQSYSPSYLIVGLTYSKVLTDRVSAGTSFKYIHEGIMSTSADGWALDFGVQYRFKSNLSIGASVKNIGGNMQYAGEDLKVKTNVPGSALSSGSGVYEADTEPFQIPSYFELSASYISQFNEQNNIELASFFRNNNNLEDLMGFGLEYSFMQTFFLRGGYNFLLENTSDYIYDFAAGAGVNYKMAGGVNLIFDYAFRNVKEFSTANHVFTLKIGIE